MCSFRLQRLRWWSVGVGSVGVRAAVCLQPDVPIVLRRPEEEVRAGLRIVEDVEGPGG